MEVKLVITWRALSFRGRRSLTTDLPITAFDWKFSTQKVSGSPTTLKIGRLKILPQKLVF